MSIKLTDTQLVLLGAAAQRKDLCLVAPPTLKGATAQKVAGKQARKAMRSRTVIRQLSRQSWTPRTLDPQKRWSLVPYGHLLHAAARSWPMLLRCLSAIMARPLRN